MSFSKVLNKYRFISHTQKDKGDKFERLMQRYLQTDPVYADELKHVWLWVDFPYKSQLGGILKSITGWKFNGNGNDFSKFSAFPGGWRSSTGAFYDIEYQGAFWTSTFFNDKYAKFRSMYHDSTSVKDSYTYNGDGFSIRCIRD